MLQKPIKYAGKTNVAASKDFTTVGCLEFVANHNCTLARRQRNKWESREDPGLCLHTAPLALPSFRFPLTKSKLKTGEGGGELSKIKMYIYKDSKTFKFLMWDQQVQSCFIFIFLKLKLLVKALWMYTTDQGWWCRQYRHVQSLKSEENFCFILFLF